MDNNQELIEKAMISLGIENVTIIFRGNDYLAGILKIEENGFDLEIINPLKPVRTEDIIQMVINIKGVRYFVSLKVSAIERDKEKFIIKVKIVGKIPLDLKDKLDELLESVKFFDTRQFERISMEDDVLQIFNIIPKAKVVFPKKEYVIFIKNISKEGIGFLTTKNFMEENTELYNIFIGFTNPAENISVGGKLLRRNIINVSGTEFAEVALKLKENMYLNKRIIEYFKKRDKARESVSKVKG
jgi:hypothetical protein